MRDALYRLARPILFSIDAETAHRLTLRLADIAAFLRPGSAATWRDQCRKVMGIEFPNPIGLAAGLDKNGEHIDALGALGLGFIEVGTVTPRPQPGNPRPRLFRLPKSQAIINRFGFNNVGLDEALRNIARRRWTGVLGINVGKNATTPIENAADDYCTCIDRVHAAADYITVNLSSPNTTGLRALQEREALDALLSRIDAIRPRLADRDGRRTPIVLKVAPDLMAEQIGEIAETVRRHRIDAVIATNTSTGRAGVESDPLAGEAGGLSGAPIRGLSLGTLNAFRDRLAGEVPLIGVGGIMDGGAARERLAAGASLIQLYSGLVYRGPGLVRECLDAVR